MSCVTSNKPVIEDSTPSEAKEMEQLKENSNQTNPKQLFNLSQKLYKEKKYENIFDPLQKALEFLKNTKHPNDETHVEFAEYYLLYGKTLLRLHQSKNNVFGMDDSPCEPENEEEVEDDADHNELVSQPQDVPLINDSTEQKKNNVEIPKPNTVSETTEKKDDNEFDNVSDGELCWQYLELSRLCLDKFLKKFESNNNNNNNTNTIDVELNDENKKRYSKLLSNVHSFIGDFLLEDGKTSESLIEYEKSIEILNNINGNKRDLASMHFLASIAAQYNNNVEKTDYHQGESEMLLVEYIKDLLVNSNFEIKENDDELTFEILKEYVHNFLTKNKENEKHKKICQELKEVIQTLDDLCNRNDTGIPEENDEKINGFDMSEFRKLLNQPDGLKALINSEMVQNLKLPEIDDKENTHNNNSSETTGITTFGFGETNNDTKNEKINELASSCVRSKRPQKRKFNEANVDNEHVPDPKRAKLNPTTNVSD